MRIFALIVASCLVVGFIFILSNQQSSTTAVSSASNQVGRIKDPDTIAHRERELHEEGVFAKLPPCASKMYLDEKYGDRSPHQVLDVFVPDTRKSANPTILWVHGGGWSGGEMTSVTQFALPFVCDGYVVVSVGYHLSWEAPFRTPLNDVLNGVRAVKRNAKRYHVDPNNIILWGASAGAHLVSLAALTHDWPAVGPNPNKKISARIAGAVVWWTPTDFLTMGEQWPKECNNIRKIEHRDSNESRLLGCIPSQCPDAARAASPLAYIRKDAPPFLIMHGNKDCTVPMQQSKELYAALQTAGASATYVEVKNGGHGGKQWKTAQTINTVKRFLKRTVVPR